MSDKNNRSENNENKELNQEKHSDLVIYETQQRILKVLNGANLPISVSRLILKELFDVTSTQYDLRIKELTQSK
ncbi:hypothetical protein [Senegalia massiliensis]|uniref:Uncharacterized protein n=1 Tax=Senegalia massiliensis TaxID=1720316 RepID=A0A845R6Z3_9CLOT|nr:hypothetical protein [Senegalia massiliensis]NBI08253.1 hypothetical protein [Senegalia massiliensis]